MGVFPQVLEMSSSAVQSTSKLLELSVCYVI